MRQCSALVSLAALAALAAAGCAGTAGPPPAQESSPEAEPLSAAPGWEAQVLFDRGEVGVWTVKCFDVMPHLAGPEVVALDDEGRCTIVFTYSGRAHSWITVEDKEWLGGLWHGDVDPDVPGAELYTGGKRGNLYRITCRPWGAFQTEALCHVEGEIHTLLGGDFEPDRDGTELLLCTQLGEVFRVDPRGPVTLDRVLDGGARIRDGAVFRDGDRDAALVVSRDGTLSLLRQDGGGYALSPVATRNQGFGRVDAGPWTENGAPVFFVGCDDGTVLRVARDADGAFVAREVFFGRRGVRGVAAEVFDADPERETVAVFGYGRAIQLLTRGDDGAFSAETLATDRDKGHWLCAGELDARNSTREILACGYGGRVIYLARPPGFGRDVPSDPEAAGESAP
jgi:hypothetical protein